MTSTTLRIQQLTPLLFRDGRPFGEGADETRAVGLVVPAPTSVAGFARTLLGTARGWDWSDPAAIAAAQGVALTAMGFERSVATETGERIEMVVPAPLDAVPYRNDSDELQVMRLGPSEYADDEGSDLPTGLRPVEITSDVKPEPGYSWWTWSDFDRILRCISVVPQKITAPTIEERTQVRLDSRRRAVVDGALFVVEYRGWELWGPGPDGGSTTEHWRLVVQLDDDGCDLPKMLLGHFGGERRPAVAERIARSVFPAPSAELRQVLTTSTRVVVRLLTPAIFASGWQPGWLAAQPQVGPWQPLLDAGPRLAAVVAGRPQTVSGWSYDQRQRGPKAGRRATPAGSAYFLELERPLQEAEIEELWMASLSDGEQDRRDGFGCSVLGVWQ